jgi:formylglycine-generating enzyme
LKFQAALLSACIAVVGCNDSKPHIKCTDNAQCTLNNRPGVCIDGSCAIADSSCPSGYRYDTAAGGSGECVPPGTDMSMPSQDDMKPECTVDTECTNGGIAPCGGSCVKGKCAYAGPLVDCGSSCTSGMENHKVCDGAGSCMSATLTCGAYQCGPTSCKTMCSNAATDCAASIPCTNSQCVSCPGDMVYVAPGSFTMGADNSTGSYGVATVTLTKPYCIDKTEVTVAQYRACVKAAVCTVPQFGGNYTDTAGAKDNLPVDSVAWPQANAYCTWSGLGGGARRLPTEAEWERAARGTDGRKYPWGADAPDCTRANFFYNVTGCHLPNNYWDVGSVPLGVSPTGIFDAAGNVAEWAADCWVANYTGNGGVCGHSCVDPVAPNTCSSTDQHTSRGGNVDSSDPNFLATFYRSIGSAYGAGFRCAK